MPVVKNIFDRYLEREALIMGFIGAGFFGVCIIRLIFDLIVTLTDSCNYIEPFAQKYFGEKCIPTQVLLILMAISIVNFTAYALFIRGIAKKFSKIMIPLITVSSLQTLLTGVLLIYATLLTAWEVVIFSAVAFPVSFCFLIISYFMHKKILAESS